MTNWICVFILCGVLLVAPYVLFVAFKIAAFGWYKGKHLSEQPIVESNHGQK
jgi:hypothetical protein